jgi:ABC-type phosphate/phosphonate transport system substrate-binding protein
LAGAAAVLEGAASAAAGVAVAVSAAAADGKNRRLVLISVSAELPNFSAYNGERGVRHAAARSFEAASS